MVIDLPFLTPLGNQWQRMHWRRRRSWLGTIAGQMAITHPQAVHKPLLRAKVVIVRYSSVEPDADAIGFVKPILDAMQPVSKRHPYGVGFITNDTRDTLHLTTRWQVCRPKDGHVHIEVEPWE